MDSLGKLNKKKARKQEKRVRNLANAWCKRLGLLWWQRIDFNYYDSAEEFLKDGNLVTVMRTRADWTRLWAEIDVNLPMVAALTDDELEYIVLHELAHVMVSPMQSKKRADLEEFTATRLAQAFRWIRDNA